MIHYQDQVYKLRIEKQDAYQTYQTYQLNMMNTMVMTVKPDQAFVTVGYEFVFQRNMSNQIVHFSIALARKLGAAQLLLVPGKVHLPGRTVGNNLVDDCLVLVCMHDHITC